MLLITCPNCGPRDETEFHYGGQAHVAYPENPAELTDAEWSRYLFYRENPKGAFAERWVHTGGCRKWFNAIRDTVTYEFKSIYTGAAPAAATAAPAPAAAQNSASATTNGGQK